MSRREIQPLQTEIMWVEGSPEGVMEAPAGYFVIDWTSGTWYRKTTGPLLATGWVIITGGGSGGGNEIGMGDPVGIAPDGTIYTDRTSGGQWYFDAVANLWFQNVGGP